ncbi:MAG: hypothetical protein ACJ790_04485 [Myxococcaceae bacterium]
MNRFRFFALVAVLFAPAAFAQYSAVAGQNAPMATKTEVYKDSSGKEQKREVEYRPPADHYGNAAGSQFDLAVDGAFEGQTIAVLHLYTGEGFDFSLPKAALKEKGFNVVRWVNAPPSPEELQKGLEKSSQLWLISGSSPMLTEAHLKIIKKFFDAGHGVYIWGDNDPYYADANQVARYLFDVSMSGNLMGNQVVPLQKTPNKAGILPHHLLTTGLEYLFEGITIATIQKNDVLTPIVYGSADNFVTGVYDRNGKRAIVDGGFTRLYIHWDTAGTARYVKNAAAWLANYEKFGDQVVADKFKKSDDPKVKMPR